MFENPEMKITYFQAPLGKLVHSVLSGLLQWTYKISGHTRKLKSVFVQYGKTFKD